MRLSYVSSVLARPARVLGAAALLLGLGSGAMAATAWLELPLKGTQGRFLSLPSPQLELGVFVETARSGRTLPVDTPARAALFEDTDARKQPAVVQARELEARGLTPEALLRFALTLSAPPSLAPQLKLNPAVLPQAESALLETGRSDLKKLAENFKALYDGLPFEETLKRHQRLLESAARAYQNALSGDAPAKLMLELANEKTRGGGVLLLPSMLADRTTRFELPVKDQPTPYQVVVVPIGEEGVVSPGKAAQVRYEEVARWALTPQLERYVGELTEARGPQSAIEPQLIRALALTDSWLLEEARQAARTSPDSADFPLLASIEAELQAIRAAKGDLPIVSDFLPGVLNQLMRQKEGLNVPPQLENADFELGSATEADGWQQGATAGNAASGKVSTVRRVAGEKKGNSALALSAASDAAAWIPVSSPVMTVTAGDRITLTARMKGENITLPNQDVTAAHLEAMVTNREGVLLRRVSSKDFMGTTGWEDVKIEFTAPASAARMQLNLVLTRPGTLFFDDLNLQVKRPEVRHFIENGAFEGAGSNAPRGWESEVAFRQALSGPPAVSRWELDADNRQEGNTSLRLAGDAGTSQWLEMRSSRVVVRPGQRVSLNSLVAQKKIVLSPGQHRHANLTLSFQNERGKEVLKVESPAQEGTRDWERVVLEAVAPPDAVSVQAGCLLTMSGELWFDDLHLYRR